MSGTVYISGCPHSFFFSSSSEKPELQLAKMSPIITAALIKMPQAASPPNSESAAATALYVWRCRGPEAAEKCEGLVERSAAPFVSLARHQMRVSYFLPRYSRSIGVEQLAVWLEKCGTGKPADLSPSTEPIQRYLNLITSILTFVSQSWTHLILLLLQRRVCHLHQDAMAAPSVAS